MRKRIVRLSRFAATFAHRSWASIFVGDQGNGKHPRLMIALEFGTAFTERRRRCPRRPASEERPRNGVGILQAPDGARILALIHTVERVA